MPKLRFTQAEVERCIRAARKTGVSRAEVRLVDGTIVFLLGGEVVGAGQSKEETRDDAFRKWKQQQDALRSK